MKNLLLSAFALLCTNMLHAQSHRLIAQGYYPFNGVDYNKTDTVNYYYSFGRAQLDSALPEQITGWAADHILQRSYNSTNGQLTDYFRISQGFDSLQRLLTKLTDYNTSGVWDTNYCTFYSYNSDNKVDLLTCKAHVIGDTYVNDYKIMYTHGQYGVLTEWKQEWLSWAQAYQNSHRVTNTYTGSKLTQVFIEVSSGGWIPSTRITYTYAGDNVSTVFHESYNAGWSNDSKISYTYDVNGDMVLAEMHDWDSTAWVPFSQTLFTYDSDHNMLSETKQYYTNGQYINKERTEYTYYPYDLVESVKTLQWDTLSGQFAPIAGWDYIRWYYYEEFDPASVSKTKKQNASLIVYPNPASGTININLHTEQTRPFSITIFDATGKSICHWNEAPATFYQKQIDVSNLPAGNYFLRIDNRPQEAVQFVILK